MALPAVVKTWNYSVNNVYTIASSALEAFRNLWYAIKNSLVSLGAWTVVSSSNSLTAVASDTWLGTSNLNWHISGSVRSWIVLQHPANGSQLLIDLLQSTGAANANPHFVAVSYSLNGFSGGTTTAAPTAADSIALLSTGTAVAWGNANYQFVHNYMYSSDGYCHRHVVYCQDFPVFAMFLESPQNPVSGWRVGLPGFVMLFNSGGLSNSMSTGVFTSQSVKTRIAGGTSDVGVYLTGESYNNNTLLTNTILAPNDLTGEYPMLNTGIISVTAPYRGKLGKPFDLWYGIHNLLAGVTYPNDNTRQFAQHGTLITPWNGSVIITR